MKLGMRASGRVNKRRIDVLGRLESQLKSGLKPFKLADMVDGEDKMGPMQLTERDVKRIKKEIATLKSRIVSEDVARSTRTKAKK